MDTPVETENEKRTNLGGEECNYGHPGRRLIEKFSRLRRKTYTKYFQDAVRTWMTLGNDAPSFPRVIHGSISPGTNGVRTGTYGVHTGTYGVHTGT